MFWGATSMAVHVKCNYNTSLMKSQFCTQGTKSHTIFWTTDHHNHFSLLLPRRLQPVISNYVMALLTRKCRLTSVIPTEKRRLKSEKIEKKNNNWKVALFFCSNTFNIYITYELSRNEITASDNVSLDNEKSFGNVRYKTFESVHFTLLGRFNNDRLLCAIHCL